MRTDLYQGHDYYLLDELLTEEHKLIRETAREWVKKEVSPIIEDAAEKCDFPDTCCQASVRLAPSGLTSQRNTVAPALTRLAMASSCRNSNAATAVCARRLRFKAAW